MLLSYVLCNYKHPDDAQLRLKYVGALKWKYIYLFVCELCPFPSFNMSLNNLLKNKGNCCLLADC
jgi:hypothetical protein